MIESPEYLTANEIAALTKKTKRTIMKRAQKESWPYLNGNGRGGTIRRYYFSGLPGAIQNLYVQWPVASGQWSEGGGEEIDNKETAKIVPGEAQSAPEEQASRSTGQAKRIEHGAENDQGKNLPCPAEPMPPTIMDQVINLPATTDKDLWHNLPEACREKGYELLAIVNRARDIRARTKKNGKTQAMKELARISGMSVAGLYKHLKKADDALGAAQASGQDTIFAQIKALSYHYGTNKNKFRAFSQPAIAFALARYGSQELRCVSDVYRETVRAATANGWRAGSYDSLFGILKRLDPATTTLARKGKKRYEADHIIKILRNYEEIWPNFQWCGDHHIFDVFVKFPDGKGGWQYRRPWLTAWMDMATRSFMGWCISFKPNSRTIAMALSHGISFKGDPDFPQHGLPQSVYIDNGKDYRAKYLNGEKVEIGKIDYPDIIEKYAALGVDPFYIDLEYDPDQQIWTKKRGNKNITVKGVRVGGVYARLGIGQHYATAYHPWAKPIERAFRTVVQGFSRSLPGWCGSGHEQRPEKLTFELKRGTVLTFEDFCARWYDWVVNEYHKRSHRGHGMHGMSPSQAFTSRLPTAQRVETKLLDFALLRKERVKIHNWGFVLDTREFELDVPTNLYGGHILNQLIGSWAAVYYDYDYKTIRIYKDGKYICDGKPLGRASQVDPDNPVMVDKLKLGAYQKQASKGILKVIDSQPEAEAGTTDDGLLALTHGDQGAERRAQSAEQDNEDVIPITADERYRQILRKLAQGREISGKDQGFKEEFEKSQEYIVSQDLYQAEYEYQQYLSGGG